MEKGVYSGSTRWIWVALFVLGTCALLIGGYKYYQFETERIRQEKYQEIAAIGKLKAGQIQQWRKERLSDISRSSRAPFFGKALREWLRDANNASLRAKLQERLVSDQKEQGYADVLLLDTDGNIQLSAEPHPHPLSPATKNAIEQALTNRTPILSDLYRCATGIVHVDAVGPILDAGGRPVAALVLRSNAESLLYPLIQSWPTPSRTAETLLVRREAEELVFLNDLRHRSDSALSLREPLTRDDLPAVQAVLGKEGIFQGKDYRGVEVLASLRPIAGSPWFMVAKVDASEILAEARYRGGIIALFAVLFIVLAAGVTSYGYRYRQVHLYRDLYRSEREQRAALNEFRTTLYSIGDAVITADTGGLVKQMNPGAERLTGWHEADAQGRPISEVFRIINEETRAKVEDPVARVLREGLIVGLANHTMLIAKDGSEYPISDSGAPICDESGAITGVVLVFQDQTENQRRLNERETRLTLLHLLNEQNDTHEMIKNITAFLQKRSGCEAVGVRLKEEDDFPYFETRGFTQEFVKAESSLCGRDSSGELVRDFNGNPVLECMCGNVLSGRFNPALPFFTAKGSFWSNCTTDLLASTTEEDRQARTRNRCNGEGYESVALFRMRSGHETLGLLQLNDRTKGRFTPQLLDFMESTADEIAIALAHRQAQARLRESEERFSKSFKNNPAWLAIVHMETNKVLEVNDAWTSIFGYTSEEAIGRTTVELGIYDEETYRKIMEEAKAKGSVKNVEVTIKTRTSGTRVLLVSREVIGIRGEPYLLAMGLDITDRKRAEEALERRIIALTRPLEETEGIAFEDLFNLEEIQRLQDQFALACGVASIITHPDGTPITKPSNFCRLCEDIIRKTDKGIRNCYYSDSVIGQYKPDGPTVQPCLSGGLWDAGTSIGVGGRHIANWLIGQVRNETQDDDKMREYAREIGTDPEAFLEAFHQVPSMSREQFERVAQALFTLAGQLSTVAYQNVQQARFISERKRTGEAIRESEERYRSLFDNMLEGYAYCKMIFEDGEPQDFIYLDVNQAFDRLTGLKNVIGKKVTEVIPGIRESNLELFQVYGRVALTGTPEKLETYVEPLGIWYSISVYSTERDHFIAVFDNITERRHAEELHRQAEHRYRRLFEDAPLMYVITRNKQGVPFVSDCNESFLSSVGYSREEIVGRPLADFYSPESCSELLERGGYTRALAGESFIGERQLLTRDGRLIPTLLHTATEVDASGEVVGTRAMFVDITERKRAEEALSKQAEFMSHLMEAIPVPVFFKDVNHMYAGCNNAFSQFVGLPRERIVGKHVFDVVSQGTAEIFREHDETLFRNPGAQVYATSVKRSDGSTREVIFHKATYGDSDGSVLGLIGVILDITDRRILEQQLFQAQKMEAVGTLAGGVAHDFNNLLQVVLGYSELILSDGDLLPQYREDLTKVNQAARNGADLVQRLLTFSRKTEAKPRPLNLNRRIVQLQKMLSRTIPKMIEIKLILADDLAAINADPTQMEQVLMNLALNARDAMPEGGKLIIQTEHVILDVDYCKTHLEAEPGRYVMLSVSDTGQGMDKNTVQHIFEPFFTTKGPGEGTGLGLAMVYGIVKQHGGHIMCYSEPGQGTVFKMYFPALVSGGEKRETETRAVPPGGSETILLVDDEQMIRDLCSRILTKSGYNVVTASNGKEALVLYRVQKEKISLVILDLIMPEMGGKQCLESLLTLDPAVKVVIASGYSGKDSASEALTSGAKGFIDKPYDVRQVLGVVRAVLDNKMDPKETLD